MWHPSPTLAVSSAARPVELSGEAGDVLTTELLPGLQLPLARIFGTPA